MGQGGPQHPGPSRPLPSVWATHSPVHLQPHTAPPLSQGLGGRASAPVWPLGRPPRPGLLRLFFDMPTPLLLRGPHSAPPAPQKGRIEFHCLRVILRALSLSVFLCHPLSRPSPSASLQHQQAPGSVLSPCFSPPKFPGPHHPH